MCNFAPGLAVPIPTLPLGKMVIFSVYVPAFLVTNNKRPLLSAPLLKAPIYEMYSRAVVSSIPNSIAPPKVSAISPLVVAINLELAITPVVAVDVLLII